MLIIFNNFHNTFLRIFYSSFPKKKIQVQEKDCTWMSKGIKISINHKRELHLSSRNCKNPKFMEHYKLYCKLLSKVIKEAKILQYKNRFQPLIIQQEPLGTLLNPKQSKKRERRKSLMNINGKLIKNQETIANTFSDDFSTTAEKLMGVNQIDNMSHLKNGESAITFYISKL
jgi:hypothetical protein